MGRIKENINFTGTVSFDEPVFSANKIFFVTTSTDKYLNYQHDNKRLE